MRILGIDPGLAIVGWAIVDFPEDKMELSLVDYGAIYTEKGLPTQTRLAEIYDDMNELINKFQPDYAGIETLVFAQNVTTGIPVGEARGVVLVTLEKNHIPIQELFPSQIKDAITGNGRAKKTQVQENVKRICGLDTIPKPDDAADAIAIAITANTYASRIKLPS